MEFILSVVAFIAAAVPVLMIVAGGFSFMASMGKSMADIMGTPPDPSMEPMIMKMMHAFASAYVMDAIVPAVIVIALIWVYAARHYPRLANRIAAGLAAGLIATIIGGEPVRLLGVAMGWFPSDMPVMFGKWITGRMETTPMVVTTGLVYHVLLNGSTFGMMYTLLAGKVHWGWGVAWLMFFETGMMLLPPVPLMYGPVGIYGAWPGLFIASLLVHVTVGVVLGLLAQRWVRDRGTIVGLLTEPESPALREARHAR